MCWMTVSAEAHSWLKLEEQVSVERLILLRGLPTIEEERLGRSQEPEVCEGPERDGVLWT